MSEVKNLAFAMSDPSPVNGDVPRETQKRLSVDIPSSLHKAVKSRCVDEDRDIRDVVIEKLTEYVNSTRKRT